MDFDRELHSSSNWLMTTSSAGLRNTRLGEFSAKALLQLAFGAPGSATDLSLETSLYDTYRERESEGVATSRNARAEPLDSGNGWMYTRPCSES